jgi:peptidyl-prolyl cis-trans isomerase D
MNKEKSSKKESTSVLEKIRRRTGLLVGIVGLALIIFILESLLGSGASIFGGNELNTIGYVNGKKIDRNEFIMALDNRINQYRQRNQSEEVGDQVRSQAADGLIQQYVLENAIMPEFHKAGISVSEDELYEKVVTDPDPSVIQNLTDPNTGKINEQFSTPDGGLDPVKWRQAVQNVTGESEMAVRQMEDMVRTSLYYQKFRALVNKGLYITTAEAKAKLEERNKTYDISFVHKAYSSIVDSTVKVSEDDIEKYYKEHKYLYKQPEDARKVEFIVFNVTPSAEDLAAVEKDAQRVAEEFKKATPSEDSTLMAQESENGMINIQNYTKKSMIVRDSSIFTAAPGTVFGPYNEGAYFKIYKLEGVNSLADSTHVRHILIGTTDPQTQQPKRTKAQAKKMADSLAVLLKEKKVSFDSLVVSVSDDMGSKAMGGDYGWWDENKGFVEPFTMAGLKGAKGTLTVVETDFGYHIMEILDVSKTRHTTWKVAQIFKPIVPSDETNQAIFAKANQFGGENNTAEQFDKAVKEQKLTPRLAENVHEGDYQIQGVEGAKDIVKWAFTAKKGDVSVFTVPGKHVVAKLAGIRNKGTLPLEEVKMAVTEKATQEKKAQMLLEQFRGAGSDLQSIANKVKAEVINQESFDSEASAINSVGIDQVMTGTIQGTLKGKLSRPTAGSTGVFVLSVTGFGDKGQNRTIEQSRDEMQQLLTGRTDYEAFNAIKESADIEIHKSRID